MPRTMPSRGLRGRHRPQPAPHHQGCTSQVCPWGSPRTMEPCVARPGAWRVSGWSSHGWRLCPPAQPSVPISAAISPAQCVDGAVGALLPAAGSIQGLKGTRDPAWPPPASSNPGVSRPLRGLVLRKRRGRPSTTAPGPLTGVSQDPAWPWRCLVPQRPQGHPHLLILAALDSPSWHVSQAPLAGSGSGPDDTGRENSRFLGRGQHALPFTDCPAVPDGTHGAQAAAPAGSGSPGLRPWHPNAQPPPSG